MKYLNNWGSFILESLILESKVVYSSKLKKVLSKMDNFCRKNIISYNDIVKKWKEEYDSVKEEIRLKFPILFKERCQICESLGMKTHVFSRDHSSTHKLRFKTNIPLTKEQEIVPN